ncbi:MAG: hypothetical protein AMXMBFR58_29820 [Phycisphaerae bacterium]
MGSVNKVYERWLRNRRAWTFPHAEIARARSMSQVSEPKHAQVVEVREELMGSTRVWRGVWIRNGIKKPTKAYPSEREAGLALARLLNYESQVRLSRQVRRKFETGPEAECAA